MTRQSRRAPWRVWANSRLRTPEEFFRNYLASESAPTASKVAAIEALGSAQGDVAPFLLSLLNDSSPDIRAAAAWALSSVDLGDAGPQLASFLNQETEAKVRARLYQALENSGTGFANELLAAVPK